jgi:hypothetical protein
MKLDVKKSINYLYVFKVVWSEALPFQTLESVPPDPVDFWSGVLNYSVRGV